MDARTRFFRITPLILLAGIAFWPNLEAAELRVGETTAPPGALVSVPVTCAEASGAVAAQFDLTFNPSAVSLAAISAGEALAGHVVDQNQLAPGHWRVLVYSLTNAPITPGAVVWLTFSIPTNATDGIVPLSMTSAIVAQIAGRRVQPLAQVPGAITIYSGGSFLSLALESDGQLRMVFQGAEGRQYAFEASTNLVNWEALSTNMVIGGTITNLEPNIAAFPQRFYRTRQLP